MQIKEKDVVFKQKEVLVASIKKKTEPGIKKINPRRVFFQQSGTDKSKYKALS